HDEPITERPPKCLSGDFTLASSRGGRQPTIQAECLPAQHRVQGPASHEARTDRKATPIVAQAVWIEESLKDAPGGVAEKPNNDHEQQRTAEWLSEDGRERAARPRYASACLGCDLKGECANDHVEHTLHKEAHAGQPLDRAEIVHRFDGTPDFSHDSLERSQVGWAPCKARERGECLLSSCRAFNACSEGNRRPLAPLLAYTLELGVFLTARAPNRRRRSPAFC